MNRPVLITAAAMATSVTLGAVRSRAREDDITGEVAIVTGASRGLGFLLARELAQHSCRLVICARDGAELEDAAARLRAAGADLVAVECDVTDAEAAQQLVATAVEHYGRLDAVVNNAGIIRVGPVETTRAADYEYALDAMALAPVRVTLAALPVMRRQGHGRIVTITSIGGKVSVPHLLPYSVAKFAAVAFSEGLRAELGAGPITVTTVVPGLMRTGSHLHARFGGRSEEEFTWFSLGASLPLVSMDAERAARRIVAAMRARKAEVMLTPAAQLAARGAAVFPELTVRLLHLTHQLLPPAAGQPGADTPGHTLRPGMNRAAFERLTALGRAAARRFNEVPQSS